MDPIRMTKLTERCFSCHKCEGAQFQTPPAFGISRGNEPILIVAQNPGEIRVQDIDRQWWLEHFKHTQLNAKAFSLWYEWDFITSNGYTRFCDILGPNWLYSGHFAYTNAVRCRTHANQSPSDEMVQNCKAFTLNLMTDRRALILVGRVAATQVLGDKPFEWGQIIPLVRKKFVLPIKHYSAWNYHNQQDVEFYKSAVDDLLVRLKLKEAV